jgi:GTP-binding protein HflX
LHVADISHPNFEEQINIVNQTLSELKAIDKPTLLVFNKIDAYSYVEKDEDDLTPRTRENRSLKELENTWMGKSDYQTLFISAKNKTNIDTLRNKLYDEVKKIHIQNYPGDNFLF